MDNQQNLPQASVKESFNFMDFLQFKRMITLQVIPILYALVAIIITLGALAMMFSGNGRSDFGGGYGGYNSSPVSFMPGGFFGGLIFLVVGNIIWRMWCEFILVLFRINRNLKDVEKNTRKSITT